MSGSRFRITPPFRKKKYNSKTAAFVGRYFLSPLSRQILTEGVHNNHKVRELWKSNVTFPFQKKKIGENFQNGRIL